MAESWIPEEIKTVDLKDKRLNRRLGEVLSQLSERPTASIPAACGGYAEMMGAYRLFANEKVGFQDVLAPHVDATRARIAAEPVAILATDTTELNLTRPEQQVIGAGPLDGGPRRGLFLHPLHAFRPDGTPLGTLHAKLWSRDGEALARPRNGPRSASRPRSNRRRATAGSRRSARRGRNRGRRRGRT